MGQLMRALGAPEVSAASGGCSEPERAGQRRRAMRAHVMREVSATRRNRMSPWKCTTKRQDVCPAFFVALPPTGAASPFALLPFLPMMSVQRIVIAMNAVFWGMKPAAPRPEQKETV